jgi:hypothetical protein
MFREEPPICLVSQTHFLCTERLTLTDNSLTGTLSPLVTKLSDLSEYPVHVLLTAGIIFLSYLTRLVCYSCAAHLSLDTNVMSGLITTEFQAFADITYLDLSNNRFSGDFNSMLVGLNKFGKG